MNNKKYHTFGIKWTTKNTTLLESNGQQKITHCRNEMDTKNTTLSGQSGIFCCSFHSDIVVFFVVHFILTVWYFLLFILFRQCGMFCCSFYSDIMVFVVVHFIPAVCYFLLFILFRQCCIFCCSFYSDSVVFFVGNFISTVWYFVLFILFLQCGIFCCSFYSVTHCRNEMDTKNTTLSE
jgi:hypothetical protein